MYLELSDIAIFTAFVLIVMIWWHGFTIRRIAISHAKRFCKQRDLQFLDDSIALNLSGFQRNQAGHLNILRHCHFEFSSMGDDRYQGTVIMLGRILVDIQTPAYRIPDSDEWR